MKRLMVIVIILMAVLSCASFMADLEKSQKR